MQCRRGVIVIQTLIGLIVVAVVLPLLTNLVQKPQDTRNLAAETVERITCERCSNNFGCQRVKFVADGDCTKGPIAGTTPTYTKGSIEDCKCGPKGGAGGGNDEGCTSFCIGYGKCNEVNKDCCHFDNLLEPLESYCEDGLFCDSETSDRVTFGKCVKSIPTLPPAPGDPVDCGKYGKACCTSRTPCEGGFVCDTEGVVAGEKNICRSVAYRCISTNPYVKDANCTLLFSKDGSTPKECSTTGGMSCWGYQSTCQLNCGSCLKGNDICCTDGKGNRFCHNGFECGTDNLCKEKVVCGDEMQKCCTGDKKCNTTDLICNTIKNICEKKVEETYWTHGTAITDCNVNGKWTCTKTSVKTTNSWATQSECENETTNKCLVSYKRVSCDDTIGKWKCELSKTGIYTDEVDAIAKNKCETPATTDEEKCEKKVECGAKDQLCCTTGDPCDKSLKLTCVSLKLGDYLWVNTCVNMSNCIYNKGSTYKGPNAIGGDFDCDGKVNIADYSVWRSEKIDGVFWNKGTTWWSDGAVEYGVLDGSDYSLWRHKFLD